LHDGRLIMRQYGCLRDENLQHAWIAPSLHSFTRVSAKPVSAFNIHSPNAPPATTCESNSHQWEAPAFWSPATTRPPAPTIFKLPPSFSTAENGCPASSATKY
jgi:hypothetical protein